MQVKHKLKFLLSVASAVILALAFPPFNLWYLAWFGFGPLILSFEENDAAGNFFKGWTAGFIFNSILLSWIFTVSGPVYLLLCLYLGLFWALFFALIFSFPSWKRILLGTCAWFFIEILLTCLFSGLPWLPLGLSQWNNYSLNRIASATGVYGISCLLMWSNLAIFYGIRKKRFPELLTLIVLVSAIVFFYPEWKSGNDKRICVTAVQGNTGRFGQDPEESFNVYSKLSGTGKKASLMVWPESSFPDIIEKYPADFKALWNYSVRQPLLFGTIDAVDGKLYSAGYFLSKDSVSVYHKRHLVPYGEYLPGQNLAFIRDIYLHFAGFIPELSPGTEDAVFSVDNVRFSPLICYENIFPEISRNKVLKGSGFLVTITNDSWYGKSFGPYQHFAHNVMRAIENSRCVVQASTTGITGVAYPDGRVHEFSASDGKKLFVPGTFSSEVYVENRSTFYTRFGELSMALACLILTGAIICRD